MIVNGRNVYGCDCCAWERRGRSRSKSAARRMLKRRERQQWRREMSG